MHTAFTLFQLGGQTIVPYVMDKAPNVMAWV